MIGLPRDQPMAFQEQPNFSSAPNTISGRRVGGYIHQVLPRSGSVEKATKLHMEVLQKTSQVPDHKFHSLEVLVDLATTLWCRGEAGSFVNGKLSRARAVEDSLELQDILSNV